MIDFNVILLVFLNYLFIKNRRYQTDVMKKNCHLSIGTGFVCHSFTMNKHHLKNKMILESRAPGK
jgi:hypothetical protein